MIKLSRNISLEPVTANKHSKLVSLIQRIYPPAYKHLWQHEDCSFYINTFYNIDTVKLELDNVNSEYYFVNYYSKTAGIVKIKYNETLISQPNITALYIDRMYLGEEAQGKGVAKKVFNWIEERALKNNNKLLWLKAMDTQNQAINFYIKEGFKIYGTTALNFDLLHKNLRGMHIMTKEL